MENNKQNDANKQFIPVAGGRDGVTGVSANNRSAADRVRRGATGVEGVSTPRDGWWSGSSSSTTAVACSARVRLLAD